jgi:alkaline phosphatase
MRRFVFSTLVVLSLITSVSAEVEAPNGPAKYVFFMIGDGMASVQIHAAEAFLASVDVNDIDDDRLGKSVDLAMNAELSHVGMQKTWAWNQLITDSAAAGTALACGYKTYAGAISVDPEDPNIAYKTLAELAKEQGKKVGILSSVSLDHATPAVFYSHQDTRNKYFHIAQEAANSGTIDFIGGGSFRYIDGYTGSRAGLWPELAEGVAVNLWTQFENNSFTVVHNLEDLKNVAIGTKCVAASDLTQDSAAMHYEIDRPASGEWSLAEVTTEAIRLLDNPNGFFMMVEGGKIDWTCHANDALTSIYDTVAFDDACRVVIEFAKQHPGECLIVVTADHETGGLTQGWAGTLYDSAYQNLTTQTMSFQAFGDWLTNYKDSPHSFYNLMKIVLQYVQPEADLANVINLVDDKEILANIESAFGVVYSNLTELQQAQLEEAYDREMTGQQIRGSEEDYLIYGGYSPLIVACTHIVNARAGLGWTTYSHTAVPVPVMANDPSFTGYYDNTDVAKKIAVAMGGSLN